MKNNYIIYKIFILLVVYVHLMNNLYAQSSFGLKFGGGVSRISTRDYSNVKYVSQKNSIMPSFNTGCYYLINCRGSLGLLLELQFQLIEGKEKSKIIVYDGKYMDYYRYRRDLLYLGLPFSFQKRFNNFYYNLGFDTKLLLLSQEKRKFIYNYNSVDPITDISKYFPIRKIKHFDYGLTTAFSYKIDSKRELELRGYYGLNNIYHYPGHPGLWKVQQLILAYKYKLF